MVWCAHIAQLRRAEIAQCYVSPSSFIPNTPTLPSTIRYHSVKKSDSGWIKSIQVDKKYPQEKPSIRRSSHSKGLLCSRNEHCAIVDFPLSNLDMGKVGSMGI
jgi:hypothetical protein